ncbi:uncharacterized protein LOC144354091 [Saccoglossus kowalevskii]
MDQQPATGKQLDEMLALTQAAFGAVTDNMQQDNAVAPIVGPSSAGADMFTRSKHVHSGTEHSEEMRSSTPATDVSHPEAYTMSSKSYSSRSQSPAVAGMNVSSNTSGSSTASDVLIRSTVINPPNQLIDKISEFGHSTISLSSISSSNNSVNGSRKIKVKAKHLREIKSPFEDANKSRGETPVPRVPPALIPVEKSDNEPKKKESLWQDVIKNLGEPLQLDKVPGKLCAVLGDPEYSWQINFISLMVRKHIYFSKYKSTKPTYQYLMHLLRKHFQIEGQIAKQNEKENAHYEKWSSLISYIIE